MKDWMKKLVIMFIALFLALVLSMVAHSEQLDTDDTITLIKGYATAYKLTGTTASGEQTRDGICASCADRLGKTVILYQRLPGDMIGEQIGIYECKDTGGNPSIKKGTLIDVWKPNLDECQEFMTRVYEDGCQGHVWIQVIDAEG